jgi:hypothetical protein
MLPHMPGRSPMGDTPRPPALPQHALIWIVVAALRLGVAPCRMARMVLTGLVDTAALLRRACLRNAKTRSYWPAHDPQTLRHSGEQVPPDLHGLTRAAAWSGAAIIGGIIAIVLSFIVYEINKISGKATPSAPHTTGEASRAL